MFIRRLTLFLLLAYILVAIYSTLTIFLSLPRLVFMTPLSTLLAFLFALCHATQRMGWKNAFFMLLIVVTIGLAMESLGVATGLVYGPYHYTARLGPKFLGLVPYLIPVAWFMMMYPSYVIADNLLSERITRKAWRILAIAAVGGIVMTAWDVAMDPLMVAGGHWEWEVQGAFFGVPLQNYWGWWLTSFLSLGLFQVIANRAIPTHVTRPGNDSLAVISYLVTALNTIIVDIMIGLGGAGLAGAFATLPWIIMGSLSIWKKESATILTPQGKG